MNAIQALLDLGADAYKNIYDVIITFPKNEGTVTTAGTKYEVNTGGGEQQVSVRCQDFIIPRYATAEDERKYKGVSLKTTKPEEDFTREFELTFRMDAKYELYEKFCKWQGRVVGPNGEVSNFMNAFGTVEVAAIKGQYNATDNSIYESGKSIGGDNDPNAVNTGPAMTDKAKVWTFEDVWVSEVSRPEFSNSSADVITYTVKFNFINYSISNA